jgi:hypothetical protein
MTDTRCRRESAFCVASARNSDRATDATADRRRAAGAGIGTKLGNHSFPATGITAYLKNGGTLEKGCGDGEPCVNAHNAALRSTARRAQPR